MPTIPLTIPRLHLLFRSTPLRYSGSPILRQVQSMYPIRIMSQPRCPESAAVLLFHCGQSLLQYSLEQKQPHVAVGWIIRIFPGRGRQRLRCRSQSPIRLLAAKLLGCGERASHPSPFPLIPSRCYFLSFTSVNSASTTSPSSLAGSACASPHAPACALACSAAYIFSPSFCAAVASASGLASKGFFFLAFPPSSGF